MTTETVPVLTDAEKANFVTDIIDYGTDFVAPLYAVVESIEQAVLQSPEIQELRNLLKEARQHLPLAAQFWNEDDEPERGGRNVKRVMKLIAKIDALLPSTPAQLAAKQ